MVFTSSSDKNLQLFQKNGFLNTKKGSYKNGSYKSGSYKNVPITSSYKWFQIWFLY